MNPHDGDFELVTLRNGARAVRHTGHGEVMHPTVGPWEEAQALYVQQSRLAEKLATPGAPLVLWDVGLGAGTNAVAALTCARALGAQQRRELHVVSFEMDLAPMRLALADPAGFPFLVPFSNAASTLMRDGAWVDGLNHWELHLGDALALWQRAWPAADVVFFDPFSPASNPSMWTVDAIRRLRARARDDGEGCTLFTYSAATPTRVSFLLGGFWVGTGASTGIKGETTAASTHKDLLAQPLDARWLARWERSSARAPHGGTLDEAVVEGIRHHAQFA